jgi:hypothetical protein
VRPLWGADRAPRGKAFVVAHERNKAVHASSRDLAEVGLRPAGAYSLNERQPSRKECGGRRLKPMGLGGLEPPTSRLSGVRSNRAELQAPALQRKGFRGFLQPPEQPHWVRFCARSCLFAKLWF